MTPDEVIGLLGLLAAAWPNTNLTEQTVAVYRDALVDLEPQDAKQAAKQLIAKNRWFPTVAEIRIEAEANAHARRNRNAADRGLPSSHKAAPPPPRVLADLRERLTEVGSKKHWHGGPEPCPVCGGLKE